MPPSDRGRQHAAVGGAAVVAFLVLLGFNAGDSVDQPAFAPAATTLEQDAPSAAPQLTVPPQQVVPPSGNGLPRRLRRGGGRFGPRGGGLVVPGVPGAGGAITPPTTPGDGSTPNEQFAPPSGSQPPDEQFAPGAPTPSTPAPSTPAPDSGSDSGAIS